VIDGGDVGTAVRVVAPGARLEGLIVRGSGTDVGGPDACVFVEEAATGAVLQDNTLEDCAFGIWVHRTDGAQVVGNRVHGRPGVRQSDRGNGVHLFDASNVVVQRNVVSGVRDGIYVSATEDSLIEANEAHDVRFGVHYMYSWDNIVRGNVATGSTVGIALMESRNLLVEENVAHDNVRQGLLFRDVQDSEIRRNRLERNGTGMFFFSSTGNVIEDNRIVDNDIGLKIWAGSKRNRVEGNAIRGNREQVFYVAADDQIWGTSGRGNSWGDYLGWDQDGDGVGDRPHRVDSFTAGLLYKYPSAVLLLRSPALETLAHLADRLPLLRTPTIVDEAPLLGETGS
jgi:nitrous oxidase accessory protein